MSNELEKQLESAKNQLSSLNAEIASYKSQDRFDGYYMMNYHLMNTKQSKHKALRKNKSC